MMRQITFIMLTIGLAGIASGHTLDSEHRLVDTLWHQLVGSHHLPYNLGLLCAGIILLAIVGRRMAKQRKS